MKTCSWPRRERRGNFEAISPPFGEGVDSYKTLAMRVSLPGFEKIQKSVGLCLVLTCSVPLAQVPGELEENRKLLTCHFD